MKNKLNLSEKLYLTLILDYEYIYLVFNAYWQLYLLNISASVVYVQVVMKFRNASEFYYYLYCLIENVH